MNGEISRDGRRESLVDETCVFREVVPETVEAFRDRSWCREEEFRVETPAAAERLIEENGFAHVFADGRTPGASLYVAVCGRRDAHLPRSLKIDSECRETRRLRDDLIRRGVVFHARVRGGRTLFVARSLVPHFHALYGISRDDEPRTFSPEARRILVILRDEWEMAGTDLRREAGITSYAKCAAALAELQRAMKIVVSDFVPPRATHVWTLTEARFGETLGNKIDEEEALGEIAGAFLRGAGLTACGELARATGLTRRAAGLGNHKLVREGYAVRVARGVYRLAEVDMTADF